LTMATFSPKLMVPTKRVARWLAERVVFVQGCCAGRWTGIAQQNPMKQTGRMTFSESQWPRRKIGGWTPARSRLFSKPVSPGNKPGTMVKINRRIIINCRFSKTKVLKSCRMFHPPASDLQAKPRTSSYGDANR